jgi:hypothetical protein
MRVWQAIEEAKGKGSGPPDTEQGHDDVPDPPSANQGGSL